MYSVQEYIMYSVQDYNMYSVQDYIMHSVQDYIMHSVQDYIMPLATVLVFNFGIVPTVWCGILCFKMFFVFFNNVIYFIQMLATINTPKVQAPFGVSLLHLVLIIQGYNQNF
jgi:hypothetical protein